MKKRRTGLFVFVLLLSMSAVSILGTALFVNSEQKNRTTGKKLTIVTSFYPVYISAMNVTDHANVRLENLTEPETGCLHDYTLKPKDMKLLSTADVFLVNGGGIENFLTDVAESYPKLKIIDLSRDFTEEELDLIHEAGGEGGHDHASDGEKEEDHDHTADTDETNAHYWMSIPLLKTQVETMAKGLSEADPVNASLYTKNAETYQKKLDQLYLKEEETAGKLSSAVIFHPAFYYFCHDIRCPVAYTLDLDEERQVSAGESKETVEALKDMKKPLILAEKTYGQKMAESMQKETDCQVIYLDPMTRSKGKYEKDGYLTGMEDNLKKIEAAFAAEN
ncbi:MAG: metal ABC transporter substrate-binding protein [Lachnospiraceae bacterium]|nr:metal ABC transporter substrate-binding protein [Lachnospiraceae bacterium]MDD6579193.1 metal ABC transporter substrate-binding protein [Lachnospiraceae bacterium]